MDWAAFDRRPLDAHQPGCMRALRPCAGFRGVREQLEALAAAQRSRSGAWEGMLVLTGTPERHARPGGGCERPGAKPRSRAPDRAGVEAYGDFVERLQRLAAEVGARVRYWSPWNEPNHPYFLSPQRRSCDPAAPSAAVGSYVALARELVERLRAGQSLVLGELAGLTARKASTTRVTEFLRGLPRDVVCAAEVAGQHAYVGGPDPVGDVASTLRGFGCPREHAIWITETGPRRGDRGVDACRDVRRRLLRWHEDPRVAAAFQYTLRDDDLFPTGLVSTDLRRPYPALAEWTAWGGGREPADPPPAPACRDGATGAAAA